MLHPERHTVKKESGFFNWFGVIFISILLGILLANAIYPISLWK